jgi:hypothetical protein
LTFQGRRCDFLSARWSKLNLDGAPDVGRSHMQQCLPVGWLADALGGKKALGGPVNVKITSAHDWCS